MKRLFLVLLLILLVLTLPVTGGAEDSFSMSVREPFVGYAENPIRITAPLAGTLTLQVRDMYTLYRTITLDMEAGEHTILWDGLGEHQQRLIDGVYTLQATLTTADGSTFKTEHRFDFSRCHQALIFALPCSDTLYLDDPSSQRWYAEVRLVRTGPFHVAFYHADDLETPFFTRKRDVSGSPLVKFTWDGTVNDAKVAPGEYVLRFYTDTTPEYFKDVHVTVKAGMRPELPLTITGPIIAQHGMSDEEIWALMMQPSVVGTVQNTEHLLMRSEPGKNKGSVVGELHGQSQAMEVLEIRDDGYALVGSWRHEDGNYTQGYVPVSSLMVVQPNGEYGLLIDKLLQTMTVYHQGKPIGTMPISSGRYVKGNPRRETPAGAYLTQEHDVSFVDANYTYDYVIRYDGENLLYQTGYICRYEGDGLNFSAEESRLGIKATKDSIRLPQGLHDGLNAYWVWTHIPPGTRVMIMDDAEDRTRRIGLLTGETADVLPIVDMPLEEGDVELVITFGGDVVLGTRETWWKNEFSFPTHLEIYGLEYPFEKMSRIFEKDDMTLVNLECVLKATGSGEDFSRDIRFRGLPEYAQILTLASIEQVNIANNHHVDYGDEGRAETRAALEAAGVAYSGYGYTYVWEASGYRIGFAGRREASYVDDPLVIERDMNNLRLAGCDLIIYSCHWGSEYKFRHNDMQEEMALAAAAAGADIIVGTHPHVVQGVDTIGDTLVLWSLGNLMFGGTHGAGMQTYDATLAQLRLRFDEQGYKGCSLTMIPILTSSLGHETYNDFYPIVATKKDKERILAQIQADTEFPLSDGLFFPAQ